MVHRRKLRYLVIILTKILISFSVILALSQIIYELKYTPNGNILCHFQSIPNSLQSNDTLRRIPKDGSSIFFHETSCGLKEMKPRTACAVESAALMNPNRKVYLLFSAPIEKNSTGKGLLGLLQQYSNVHIARIEFNEYIKNTPLNDWVDGGILMKSMYRVSHTSDILRYLTLWKYGGIYLDTDIIVVKNFDNLVNQSWSAHESETSVSAGAMGLGVDELGRKIADEAMRELKYNFETTHWGANGPGVITRILQRHCDTRVINKMNKKTCHGFEIFGPEYFYPVPYQEWMEYFDSDYLEKFKYLTKPYIYHFWNSFSKNEPVKDNVPYSYLAKKYCPRVYEATKTYF